MNMRSRVRPLVRSLVIALTLGLVVSACVPAPPVLDADAVELAAIAPLDLDEFQAAQVLRAAREFTVRIRSIGCDQLGTGSGFVLDDGLIVTNRHVVGQPREITINTWDGRTLSAQVEGIALDADLAVIRVSGADLPVATLRTTPVVIGEKVAAIGYPGGGPSTITTGRVLGLTDRPILGEQIGAIIVDASVAPGNSGGPLIDAEGRVIGVIFALSGSERNGLAVPAGTLLDLIEQRGFTPPTGC